MDKYTYREIQRLKSIVITKAYRLDPVLDYLYSKQLIGLIKVVLVLADDMHNHPCIALNGVTEKIWKSVLEPEVRRLVKVKTVRHGVGMIDQRMGSSYRESEGPFVRIWLDEKKGEGGL